MPSKKNERSIPSFLTGEEPLYGVDPSQQPAALHPSVQEAQRALSDAMPIVLREMREEQGLSQAKLAQRTGVTTNVLWQLETQRATPTIDTLHRLADGMSMTVEEVMLRTAGHVAHGDPTLIRSAGMALREITESQDARPFQNAFGELLSANLEVEELTQEDIMRRTNFSRSTISKVIRGGEQGTGVGTYFGLAPAFQEEGVSAPEFLELAAAQTAGVYWGETTDAKEVIELLEQTRERMKRGS